MDVSDWTLVARNFADERAKHRIPSKGSALEYHPLLPAGRLKEVADAKKKADAPPPPPQAVAAAPAPTAEVMDDPLSMSRTKVTVDDDPLAMMMGGGGAAPVAPGSDPLSFSSPPAPGSSSSSSALSSSGAGKGDDYGYGSSSSSSSSKHQQGGGVDDSAAGSLANLKADADRKTLADGASWDAQKKMILREDTVSGNIKIGASFMKDADYDE
jgi:hypothetical protein